MEVKITKSTENNYVKYPQQCQPQPAFVEFDLRSGEIWSGYNPEIGGGTPGHVWNGDAVRWGIPADLTTASINEVLSEVAKLQSLQKALDAYHDDDDDENVESFLEDVEYWFERNQFQFFNMQRMRNWTWSEWFENTDIFEEMSAVKSLEDFIGEQERALDEECTLEDDDELVDFIVSEIDNAEKLPDLPAWATEIREIAEAIRDFKSQ